MQSATSPPNLDAAFAALADPTRRAILARLAAEGEVGAGELGRPFQMSQPAVSRHLRVLEKAGLIVRRVDGTRRPCRLVPEAVAAVDAWLDTLRRAEAALEALPPANLTADIAPVALATGPAETLAAVITGVAALRLPLLAVVAVGAASVVALRALFDAA